MQRLFPTSKARGPATDIYDDIHFPEPPARRPYVALNMVSTVDGKTTLDEGRLRGPIGSPVDRALMGRLRVPVDGVIRGASTVRRSPYYPGVPEEVEHLRIARGLPRQPRVIVVTGSGDLPLDMPFFRDAPRRPIVIAPKGLSPNILESLQELAVTILVGEGAVDLPRALERLRHEYGIEHLLSEGGPRLNYEFLRARLLDEIFWTIAPKIGGNGQDLTLVHGDAILNPLPRLRLLSAFGGDDELFLRYKVHYDE